ncbi:MAG: hypothetical protein WBL93_04380 [Lutisporaceae bacterium]
MTAYLIIYSCKSSVKKFKEVDALIKECAGDNRWMYHLNNTWIIKSERKANEIGTKLDLLTENHDDFLVIEIVDNYACWLPQKALDFLREHIFD